MRRLVTVTILCLIFVVLVTANDLEYCDSPPDSKNNDPNCGGSKYLSNKRYILYDVNPPEGFNLRRDVYIRVAVFMKHLQSADHEYNWNLVLPPWGNLYHWRSRDVGQQVQIPWGLFFDVESLKKFAPVIEMHQFFQESQPKDGHIVLDNVYVLQNDPKMFETGNFKDKNEVIECSKSQVRYKRISKDMFNGYFWGYSNITAKNVKCIKFHGMTSHLVKNLQPDESRTFMFDHMEIPLHDHYGSKDFWRARRSMRYNSELYALANEFRAKYLNSTDDNDNIKRPDDWRDEKEHRKAVGGPYLAVHLRRQDFLRGRAETVPSIQGAAEQLSRKLKALRLKRLFVATDADNEEYEELKDYLSNYKIYRYKPSTYVKNKFKDGGVAVIDQIICSCARYFIGTHESTFSFRIQEDREILGFPTAATFNRLCNNDHQCSPESKWEIVY